MFASLSIIVITFAWQEGHITCCCSGPKFEVVMIMGFNCGCSYDGGGTKWDGGGGGIKPGGGGGGGGDIVTPFSMTIF